MQIKMIILIIGINNIGKKSLIRKIEKNKFIGYYNKSENKISKKIYKNNIFTKYIVDSNNIINFSIEKNLGFFNKIIIMGASNNITSIYTMRIIYNEIRKIYNTTPIIFVINKIDLNNSNYNNIFNMCENYKIEYISVKKDNNFNLLMCKQ
jgi:hypothetical protein